MDKHKAKRRNRIANLTIQGLIDEAFPGVVIVDVKDGDIVVTRDEDGEISEQPLHVLLADIATIMRDVSGLI